jgi:glucose/mannose-6-phosphate isomerase
VTSFWVSSLKADGAGAGRRDARVAPGAALTPAVVARLDRDDMARLIAGLGDQLAEGWRLGVEALSPEAVWPRAAGTRPNGVCVCGMGGSAIGGDLLRASLPDLSVPYEVVRGYELPAWVGPESLVLAVSYSGNTEETLACLRTALARGCRPVCVASGGSLAAIASERALPLVIVPGGLQPRAATGYLTMPAAAALSAAGLAKAFADQIGEAASLARAIAAELDPAVPEAANPAKMLAHALHGRLTLVYGAGLTAPVARRWKGQINENAKALAFTAELPELDHNELMGWTSEPELARQAAVVMLVDPQADDRLVRRVELTAAYVREHAAFVEVVRVGGESRLARLVTAVALGDWVSYYLALLYAVDPTPVAAIEAFKRRLADPAARG